MELIERSDCPFCWKVRLALAEADVTYDATVIALGEKHPQVVSLNPKATVPVMIDGATALWESTVMLEYINDQYANGRLYAGTAADRARVRGLVAYSDSVVGPALRDLVFERRSKRPEDQDQDLLERSLRSWGSVQGELDRVIGERAYFGEGFSAADCALLARLGVAHAYDAGPREDVPQLAAWFERMQQRSCWQRAYPTQFIRPQS